MLVSIPRMILLLFCEFRKQRYVYCTILDNIAKVTGIVKFDLHAEPETGKKVLEVGGNVLGIFDLGPGRFGSEAIFVPREAGTRVEEDDGYLIFFVFNETTGYSLPPPPPFFPQLFVLLASLLSPYNVEGLLETLGSWFHHCHVIC